MNIFKHDNKSLEYLQFGDGKTPLFAFHGFGRSGTDFLVFEPFLKRKYTVYAFNLFLHGNSEFPTKRIEKSPLTEKELKLFFDAFLVQNKITHFGIMGYSLGGKIALSLLQHFPKQVTSFYLLAPDGIVINRWYNYTSRTITGRIIYKRIIKKPESFVKIVKGASKVGLIGDKMEAFVLNSMSSEEKRILVYNIWLVFSLIKPNITKIQAIINVYKIPCSLYFGKHDKIIKPSIGKRFAAKIKQKNVLTLVDTGHILISEKVGKMIKKKLENT